MTYLIELIKLNHPQHVQSLSVPSVFRQCAIYFTWPLVTSPTNCTALNEAHITLLNEPEDTQALTHCLHVLFLRLGGKSSGNRRDAGPLESSLCHHAERFRHRSVSTHSRWNFASCELLCIFSRTICFHWFPWKQNKSLFFLTNCAMLIVWGQEKRERFGFVSFEATSWLFQNWTWNTAETVMGNHPTVPLWHASDHTKSVFSRIEKQVIEL